MWHVRQVRTVLCSFTMILYVRLESPVDVILKTRLRMLAELQCQVREVKMTNQVRIHKRGIRFNACHIPHKLSKHRHSGCTTNKQDFANWRPFLRLKSVLFPLRRTMALTDSNDILQIYSSLHNTRSAYMSYAIGLHKHHSRRDQWSPRSDTLLIRISDSSFKITVAMFALFLPNQTRTLDSDYK